MKKTIVADCPGYSASVEGSLFLQDGLLSWFATKAIALAPATPRVLAGMKNVALLVAAPFIGLVYAVLLPFVGIAMIAKTGYDAYRA